MSSPTDDSVIVYDKDKRVYEPSPYTVDEMLGGGGGPDQLIIVNGGTVTLDDDRVEGSLLGYRVKATTTFVTSAGEVDLVPGAYTLERTSTSWIVYPAAEGTEIGAGPSGPSWTSLASDTFTGSGDLTGHQTTTGTRTWTSAEGSLILDGDEAVWNTHAAGASNFLPLGVTHEAGLRHSVDYRPGDVAGDGSRFIVMLATNFTSTTYGNEQFAGIQLELQPNGTMTLSEQMVGADTLGLSGTLIGLPTSGRLTLEVLGTAVSVLLDDVEIASGTIPGTPLGSRTRLGAYNRSVAYDNYVVEEYA
jgi:hypothetical protein